MAEHQKTTTGLLTLMDIQIQTRSSLMNSPGRWLAVGIGLLLLLLIGLQLDSSIELSRNEVWIAEVQQGPLEVNKLGFGHIRSQNSRWLISHNSGVVERIHIKPGSEVKKGDVILTLINSELLSGVDNAKAQFDEQQGELQALQAQLAGESLQQQRIMSKLQFELKRAKIELSAHKKLIDIGTISKVEYERSTLLVQQQTQQLELEKQLFHQYELVKQAKLATAEARVSRFKQQLAQAQAKVAQLDIVADSNGMLTQMAAELVAGKNVKAGTALVEITATNALFAEVKVAVSGARALRVGMKAVIEVQDHRINGLVNRIDPRTNNGQVIVDIFPQTQWPSGVLLGQAITAKITTEQIAQALYIKRPPQAQPNSKPRLYIADSSDSNQFKLGQVEFGQDTGAYMLLNGAIQAGQKVAYPNFADGDLPTEFNLKDAL